MSWNIGSVTAEVSKRVSVPSQLSGTGMDNIVIGAINTIYEYTGLQTGSTNISERFYEPLVCFAAAQVAAAKQALESTSSSGDGGSYKIGDFAFDGNNYNTGNGSRISEAQKYFEETGINLLKRMGYRIKFGKANG